MAANSNMGMERRNFIKTGKDVVRNDAKTMEKVRLFCLFPKSFSNQLSALYLCRGKDFFPSTFMI